MKPLDSIAKRDLLAAAKFDPDEVRAYADQFFSEERYGDAFEFYRKLDDRESVRRVKEAVIGLGDPEVLWRVEHTYPEEVCRDDWLACGESAMKMGKYRSAAFAFERAGDRKRQAEAEKRFRPASAEAESPEPPPRQAGPRGRGRRPAG